MYPVITVEQIQQKLLELEKKKWKEKQKQAKAKPLK